MAEARINERQAAGASYLLTFYQEIINLTHHYAQYSNLLVEAKNKYGNKEINEIEDDAKNIIVTEVQSVRYSTYKCYIMYKTIIPSLKLKENKDLLALYNKIKEDYLIKQEDLENFVIALNSVLITEVIKNLLDTSQALVEDIYKNAATTTTS